MEARVLSIVPVVRGAGPEMDRSEAVTLFNDLCLLAPAALIDAPVTWRPVDDARVRGTYRAGGQEVSAVLTFGVDGDLADFVSDDRDRAGHDGRSFTPTRWSTPVNALGHAGDRRHVATASAVWHAPGPDGTFVYAELAFEDVVANPGSARQDAQGTGTDGAPSAQRS
jgi:hypothetical protein